MFKKGFTVAEILVALGVIGIVAAISSPILSNVIPDRDKISMLKAYKNLNDITQEIVNDPGYYINGTNCEGLGCTDQALAISNDTTYSGNGKYANLLARSFNGEDKKATKISDTVYTFEAADNSSWKIEKNGSNHYVTVDINGSDEGKNSHYTSEVKKPDQFIFLVKPNGAIHPNDALTDAYLRTKSNLKNNKNDLKEAAVLYNKKYKK